MVENKKRYVQRDKRAPAVSYGDDPETFFDGAEEFIGSDPSVEDFIIPASEFVITRGKGPANTVVVADKV